MKAHQPNGLPWFRDTSDIDALYKQQIAGPKFTTEKHELLDYLTSKCVFGEDVEKLRRLISYVEQLPEPNQAELDSQKLDRVLEEDAKASMEIDISRLWGKIIIPI